MDITQAGAPAGAFGTDTIIVRDAGQDVKLALYNYDEDTKQVTYNYGYPVFQLGRIYNFKIKAYEPYVNYDVNKENGKLYKDMLRDSSSRTRCVLTRRVRATPSGGLVFPASPSPSPAA